ncbi:MAG: hypothetical protein LBQ18_08180 [Campylobacteraceae bacterium]|jgi:hypothetical protein|nr:hypothetical protein [Campylobacteraceae bacterium]
MVNTINRNNITDDIIKIGETITQACESVLEGLESDNAAMLERAMEQLADIDIKTNKIDNKIVASIPVVCKDERIARELLSHIRIITEFTQTAYALRYFCKNATDYADEPCFIAIKESVLQLFKSSVEAFAMSVQLVQDDSDIEDIFRKIKTERITGSDLYSAIKKDIAKVDTKSALNIIRILNIVENIENVTKSSISIAKTILLAQDGGKLRIY